LKNSRIMDRLGLAVIADDLTGAMDCCGYFGGLGFTATVYLNALASSASEVLAVTTNSRAESPDIARARVVKAVRQLAPRPIFKKIDSTLRGNVGVELSATLEELGAEKTIVAPAFPEMGRTTVRGLMLVDGVPVSETHFADDPAFPVKESSITVLLEKSTGRRVAGVSIEQIEAGPDSLHARITAGHQHIWVCDATQTAHLAAIARAAALAEGRWLLCGSTGLVRELQPLLGKPDRRSKRTDPGPLIGCALVLVGSLNPVSAEQVLEAKERMALIGLDFDGNVPHSQIISSHEIGKILTEAQRLLKQGLPLAISSIFSPRHPEMKARVPSLLAEIAEILVEEHRISGLFLSGGDVAWEVCRRLGLSPISVLGEVEPGVPAAVAERTGSAKIRSVTKAGGFGSRGVIVKSLPFLGRGEVP
jgi:uncharacterized protein YgbK (DUF1537 family)